MKTQPSHMLPTSPRRATAHAASLATTDQWKHLTRWLLITGLGLGLSFLTLTHALAASDGHADTHGNAHSTPASTAARHSDNHAKDSHAEPVQTKSDHGADRQPELPANHPRSVAERLRDIVEKHGGGEGSMTLLVGNETLEERQAAMAAAKPHAVQSDGHGGGHIEVISPRKKPSKHAQHGNAKSHGKVSGHSAVAHWDYTGETGPANWGSMKPEFSTCDSGLRQSPIHIQSMDAMPGPAEPIEFHYMPSGGSVVNNGHTIQVDPMGHNYIKVRGSVYKLVQFHFHHPAEEKVNYKGFAMVAHLVHKNEAGQLAVVAILMDVGHENTLVRKVWTHMPLDVNDRVGLPDETVDLFELLPSDQRYFQFMGSLTTPPCTEGVLWLVIKQPVTVGPQQLKAFARLFPMNARPTQEINGRLVREGM